MAQPLQLKGEIILHGKGTGERGFVGLGTGEEGDLGVNFMGLELPGQRFDQPGADNGSIRFEQICLRWADSYWFGRAIVVAGLFAGATTNTPALGAAQQALASAHVDPALITLTALSYAASYPLAIVGIIVSLIIMRAFFKVDVTQEAETFRQEQGAGIEPLQRMYLRVENPNLDGVAIASVPGVQETSVIISRHRPAAEVEVTAATPEKARETALKAAAILGIAAF